MSNIKPISLKNGVKLDIKLAKSKSNSQKIEKFSEYEDIDYTDINRDGITDVKDATYLQKITDGTFIGPLPETFDFNKDSKVDSKDVDALREQIARGAGSAAGAGSNSPGASSDKTKKKNEKIQAISDLAFQAYENAQNNVVEPGDDQGSKYRKWYDENFGTNLEGGKYDWCAAFVTYLFGQNDGIDKYIKPSTFADNLVRDSVKAGYGTWYEDNYHNSDPNFKPQKGDLIVFDPQIADSYYEAYPDHVNDPYNTMNDKDMYLSSHIGYVYDVYQKEDGKWYVCTIEGNKGNQVKKCEYPLDYCGSGKSENQRINGYYRPNYDKL